PDGVGLWRLVRSARWRRVRRPVRQTGRSRRTHGRPVRSPSATGCSTSLAPSPSARSTWRPAPYEPLLYVTAEAMPRSESLRVRGVDVIAWLLGAFRGNRNWENTRKKRVGHPVGIEGHAPFRTMAGRSSDDHCATGVPRVGAKNAGPLRDPW